MITDFKSSYYHQFVNNIQIPRGWLCYSMELVKPYCEVCWLFADRSQQIFDQMAWGNRVSGSTHNMIGKIQRHGKTANHIESSAVYLKRKSGKTLDEKTERELRRSSRFWVKVLDRIISIILTLTTLNLALRGHREEAFEGNYKGGNSLD